MVPAVLYSSVYQKNLYSATKEVAMWIPMGVAAHIGEQMKRRYPKGYRYIKLDKFNTAIGEVICPASSKSKLPPLVWNRDKGWIPIETTKG